jgi:hypothetical protein
MEQPAQVDEKIVQIAPPQPKKETKSLIITISIIAFVIGLIAFGGGFLIGKINLAASTSEIPKESTPSASVAGWSVYYDEETLFSVSHPKDWKAKKHSSEDYSGVKITAKKGYVDLWLLVDQPFLLGEKHQKAIESEEEIKVKISDKEALGVQYNYKAGNYFIMIILPDSQTSPQVTFWVEADDEKTRDETLKIVESFQFQN